MSKLCIENIPDLTEREIDRHLCFTQTPAVTAALEVAKRKYQRERAEGNSMSLLLQGTPLQQIRWAAGLVMAALANDNFPPELKTRGTGAWLELRGLEEKYTKLSQRTASGAATGSKSRTIKTPPPAGGPSVATGGKISGGKP